MPNIEWTNNSKIDHFWSQNVIFQIKNFLEFLNFPIWTIPKTSSLKNSKKFQFDQFQKFEIWQIQKNSIWKFPKIYNFEN